MTDSPVIDPSEGQSDAKPQDHIISDQTMISTDENMIKEVTDTELETLANVLQDSEAVNCLSNKAATQDDSIIPKLRLTALFDRIISSDLRILSAQKDAPDPTEDCQRTELERLFREKPGQFLYRFLSCVQPEDKGLFSGHNPDPTVSFYLDRIARKTNDAKVVRNRRYARLQELLAEGSYFSDEEMKKRQPKLHYQLIGQFETEEEKSAKVREHLAGHGKGKFSEFLLHQSDRSDYLARNTEEEDEEDEEDEEVYMSQQGSKEELAAQFQSILMEKFLAGEDAEHVCYQDIDYNEKYDDLKMRSRDAEDSYFDGESSDGDCIIPPEEEDERPFNPPPLRPVTTVMKAPPS